MNAWLLIRRLRGPAFLILVGITALLNQWGVLSFSRSWPLYLILAGVLGLAERAAMAAAPPVPPVYPVRSMRPPPMRRCRPYSRIHAARPARGPMTRSPIPTGGRDGHPAPSLFPARRGPGAALLPALSPPPLHARPGGADRRGGDRPAGRNQQAECLSPVGLVYALVAPAADRRGLALAGRMVAGPAAAATWAAARTGDWSR